MTRAPLMLTVLAALGAPACAQTLTATDDDDALEANELDDEIDDWERRDTDLQILADLDIVEVGELVIEYPEGSMNCYGPCPGFEEAIAQAEAEAALRLEALTAAAVAAVEEPVSGEACDTGNVYDDLAALEALQIVEVKGLVQVQPEGSPCAYSYPCCADSAPVVHTRAEKLARIVAATEGL